MSHSKRINHWARDEISEQIRKILLRRTVRAGSPLLTTEQLSRMRFLNDDDYQLMVDYVARFGEQGTRPGLFTYRWPFVFGGEKLFDFEIDFRGGFLAPTQSGRYYSEGDLLNRDMEPEAYDALQGWLQQLIPVYMETMVALTFVEKTLAGVETTAQLREAWPGLMEAAALTLTSKGRSPLVYSTGLNKDWFPVIERWLTEGVLLENGIDLLKIKELAAAPYGIANVQLDHNTNMRHVWENRVALKLSTG